MTRGWDAGSAARVVRYRRIAPPWVASACGTAGSSRTWSAAHRGQRARARRAASCRSTRSRCPAGTASPTSPPRSRSGPSSGSPPTPSARAWRIRRRRASPGAGRDGRRRPLRQRLAGHPAGRGHRRAAQLPAADRAHLRRPLQGRGHRRARGRGRRAGHGRGAHRRERAGAGRRVPGGRPGAHRARRLHGRGGPDRRWHRARRPSSRRRRGRRAGDRAAEPGCRELRHVPDYAARGRAFKRAVADARQRPAHEGTA